MTWYRKNPLFATALTLCVLLVLGEFGRLYFGDLDSVRPRQRMVHFQVIGD